MDMLVVIALTLISAMIAAFAQYVFKTSVPKFKFNARDVIGLARNRSVLFGLSAYVLSLAVYLVALHFGQLSYIYPVFASSFVFVFLISRYKLKEELTGMRMVGIALVVLGVVIVSLTY